MGKLDTKLNVDKLADIIVSECMHIMSPREGRNAHYPTLLYFHPESNPGGGARGLTPSSSVQKCMHIIRVWSIFVF